MMGTQSPRPQAMAMAIAFISTLLIMAYMKLSRVYIRERPWNTHNHSPTRP